MKIKTRNSVILLRSDIKQHDSSFKNTIVEQEILETVIREMLGEQQLSIEKISELSEQIDRLRVQVREFKSLIANIKLEVPSIDTFRVEGILFDQHEIVCKQLNELKEFIMLKRKEKKFLGKIFRFIIPWLLVFYLTL